VEIGQEEADYTATPCGENRGRAPVPSVRARLDVERSNAYTLIHDPWSSVKEAGGGPRTG